MILSRLAATLLALVLTSDLAAAQSKVTIAVGGAGCLCYLPTVLALQLGEFKRAGLAVDLVDLKGGSDALRAVLGGSADVVSGYFDHCINLAAKKQELVAFVVYDRYPGEVLVVSPAHTGEIKSIKDLAGKKVGVTARFLPEISAAEKRPRSIRHLRDRRRRRRHRDCGNGTRPDRRRGDAGSVGQRAAGQPSGPAHPQRYPHPEGYAGGVRRRIPGGALYSTAAWVAAHDRQVQALTQAILNTLTWIHAHSPEDIMAKMPPEMVGKNKELYLAALKNTIPMYSETGKMDPKGAEAVLAVFSQSSPDVAKANIDVGKTYTNKYVEQNAK
jgi:NitT/TauT family transport system substrate-binding protein